MATPVSPNNLWDELAFMPNFSAKPLPYVVTAMLICIVFYNFHTSSPMKGPIINPRKPFELTETRSKQIYVSSAIDMIRDWFKKRPEEPVRIITDFGDLMLLPPKFADEVRNDDRLSFSKWTFDAFHARFPGFEGFREGSRDSHLAQQVIQRDLTKSLNKVTEPLSDETKLALPELFGDSKEWHTIPLKNTVLQLIARLSSRVFLGEELCRNEAWLKVTREYTVTSFNAAQDLRLWPRSIRFLVHWFLPACHKARVLVREARRVIDPVLAKRREEKLQAMSENRPAKEYNDAIEWFEQSSKGRFYDPATSQLLLSLAAIHTTTDLTCQVITDLANHPEMILPLREEIITVLKEGGWKKASLYNMKLLDSVIKESQRMKPISVVAMRRLALQDVKLSDNTRIPKGSYLAVSGLRAWDPAVHDHPEQWDGYRFLRMRGQPGGEHSAQLVSTSADHLAFGHGQHACPGRFFAANEVKVALVHLLLGYEWRLPSGQEPKVMAIGFSLNTDPFVKIEVKRREDSAVDL